MKIFNDKTDPGLVTILRSGGVAVIRTDTLYGLLGRADNEQTVARIHSIKGRAPEKACIILLPSVESAFDHHKELMRDIELMHDVPTSFILNSHSAPQWLRHTDATVAYRIPQEPSLLSLLQQTGPLIAPSANPQSLPPARSIEEAIKYFGEGVDAYVDGGIVLDDISPSRLLRVHDDGSVERLR